MFRKIRNAALSAIVVLGALAAAPVAAQASSGNLYLGFGSSQHGVGIGFQFGNSSRQHYRPGRHHRTGTCSPREAVHKASRMGLRHARVVHVGYRAVAVEGRGRGNRLHQVVFANTRHCPVIH